MEDTARNRLWGYLSVIVAIFLFSTVEVAAKYIYQRYGNQEINHYQIAFLRFFFGLLFIFSFMALRKKLDTIALVLRKNLLPMLVLGVLGIYLTFTFYYWGLERTSASTAAIIFSTNPIFTAIIAIPMLREKVKLRVWLGFLLGLLGAYLTITGMSFTLPLKWSELSAGLAMLASAVSWALYTVLGKKYAEELGQEAVSMISMGIGAFLFLLTIVIRGETGAFTRFHLTTWLVCLYIGIFTVGIGYLFYFGGMKKVPAASGASLFFLKPAVAVTLAWAILGEQPGKLVVPVLLASVGIILASYREPVREWVED